MDELIIVGAGGHGREIAWLASQARAPFKVLGFLDDRPAIPEKDLGGVPRLGSIADWPRFSEAQMVVAIGNPRVRTQVIANIERIGAPRYAILIHRDCLIGPECRIEAGTMICAGVILTLNVRIGRHVIVNIGTSISHDCRIGDVSTIAPKVALAGCVTVGPGAEIGMGASIRQGLSVGAGAFLGMGSVLTKNIPDNTMWFGNPAKEIKTLPAWNVVPPP